MAKPETLDSIAIRTWGKIMGMITAAEVRGQLAEILSSNDFQASQRLKNFLSYIVEASLSGAGQNIKAYTLALEVFGQGDDFDPAVNPLVRTEAGRLRSRLDHYYLLHPEAEVHISIPKGGYSATFARAGRESAGSEGQAPKQYSFSPQVATSSGYKAAVLVMPFSCVNETEEIRSFVTGLVNEIVLGLTRFQELRIINHSRLPQPAAIFENGKGKKSEARFVLNGCIQLERGAFKTWVELMDTTTGHNIWAEKFDAILNRASVFTLQEDTAKAIVYRIADDFGLLQRTLLKEVASGVVGPSGLREAALLYYHWTTVLSREDFRNALHSVEKNVSHEPGHAFMQAMLADLYASDYQWRYGLVENALEKSLSLAIRAISIDSDCQLAHLAMALNYFLRKDKEKFVASAERTVEINPYSTNVLGAIAPWFGLCGMWERAMELIETVQAVDSGSSGWFHLTLSLYQYMRQDFAVCLDEAKKIYRPEFFWDPILRLASGGFLGEKEECEQALADLLHIYPDFLENGTAYLDRILFDESIFDLLSEGLNRAGVHILRPHSCGEASRGATSIS